MGLFRFSSVVTYLYISSYSLDEIEHVYLPYVPALALHVTPTNIVLRITLCTVSFSISLAAMLLMPITIASNEVILNFPNSYYTQWLHRELIFGKCQNRSTRLTLQAFLEGVTRCTSSLSLTHTQLCGTKYSGEQT